MAFEPANEVERLLMRAPSEPSVRPAFYRALLESDLHLVTDPEHPPKLQADGTVDPESPLSVRMIVNQGKPHAPIFSAAERIAAVSSQGGLPYVTMPGRDLFAMMRESDIVLNPGSDFGKVFTKAEIAQMLDGSIFDDPMIATEGGGTSGGHKQLDVGGRRILLGQPSDYPKHLTDGLAVFFATVPAVRTAYLAHGSIEGTDAGDPHTIIGIETDGGDWNALMQQVGGVLNGLTRPGEFVDLVQMRSGGGDVIGDYMKTTSPFYRAQRKKFLGLF